MKSSGNTTSQTSVIPAPVLTEYGLYLRPHIICKDGTRLSVQSNRYAYCTPQTDEGPHTHFE